MWKKLLQSIKYWGQVFLLPLYWFSFITPRSKKIWLFGSTFGKRFADNPKYFYLYLNQYKKEEIRTIWISHDKKVIKMLQDNGYETYYYHSLKGIFYCLCGGVYIFDNYSKDISFWLSGGAKKINLWHGVGNKKINYDNRFDTVRHPKDNWNKFKTYLRRMSDEKPKHYTLATSDIMADIFASAFRTTKDHIIVEGYPRNDVLLSDHIKNLYSKEEKEAIADLENSRLNGTKIIIYMPTFRASETKFFDIMEIDIFNEFLKEKGYFFFTKLHPKSKLKKQFEDISFSNIKHIPAEVDPYGILKYIDLLVTDYSSIYSDFLMMNKPSVLFPYDYDEYSKDTRDCYFAYEDYMKDKKAYTMKELMDGIALVFENDACEADRIEVRDWMFATADGYASKRLYEKINQLLLR